MQAEFDGVSHVERDEYAVEGIVGDRWGSDSVIATLPEVPSVRNLDVLVGGAHGNAPGQTGAYEHGYV